MKKVFSTWIIIITIIAHWIKNPLQRISQIERSRTTRSYDHVLRRQVSSDKKEERDEMNRKNSAQSIIDNVSNSRIPSSSRSHSKEKFQ